MFLLKISFSLLSLSWARFCIQLTDLQDSFCASSSGWFWARLVIVRLRAWLLTIYQHTWPTARGCTPVVQTVGRLATAGPLAAADHSKKGKSSFVFGTAPPFFMRPASLSYWIGARTAHAAGLKLAKPVDLTSIFLFSAMWRRVVWYKCTGISD